MLTKEEVKFIRSLHLKKFRKINNAFIIEGHKMIEEAIDSNSNCISKIYKSENSELNIKTSLPILSIPEKQLKQISTLKQPQGSLAICQNFELEENTNSELILALDNIQDPGNFGTILRLAAWFGVKKVLASHDCVELFNPKVVQASMGAIFNVSVKYLDLLDELKNCDLPIYGALLEGKSIYTASLPKKAVLIVGNEGNGISESIKNKIQYPLNIPKFGSGESLNVATAAGILLSEFMRL